MLFGKSPDKPSNDSPADLAQSFSEASEAEASKVSINSFPKVEIEIEKIKENLVAMREVQKMNSERFTRVSEQIGELRSMTLEREKESQKLEARIIRAIDLVEEIQPENLFKEIKREDIKIEALGAKLEGNTAYMDRHTEELKQLRNQMAVFRGLDAVLKLNSDMKDTYSNVKKISAMVDQHSDKVSGLFTELQSKFSEMQVLSNKVTDTGKSIESLVKDTNDLKTRVDLAAKKSDLEAFKNDLAPRLDSISKILVSEDMKDLKTYIERMNVLQSQVTSFKTELDNLLSLKSEVSVEVKQLDKKMETIARIQGDINTIKDDLVKVISGDQAVLLKMGQTEAELRKKMAELEAKRVHNRK
jgi:chromosome segregation ATPase